VLATRRRRDEEPTDLRSAGFRYGLVFGLTFVLLVFSIVTPDGAAGRTIGIGLELAALLVVIATSRERESVRRSRAIVVGLAGAALLVGIATGVFDKPVSFAAAALLAVAIPAGLVRGLVRLIQERGVTPQAIAGALAIYLSIGLLFAFAIAFVSAVASTPYFAQGDLGTGDRVYFSFTVLTTTGFGDYTPAHPAGHALAVVEMLTGQLYLVTVVGVMIGHFVGARARR
jgi:hypothetical protein